MYHHCLANFPTHLVDKGVTTIQNFEIHCVFKNLHQYIKIYQICCRSKMSNLNLKKENCISCYPLDFGVWYQIKEKSRDSVVIYTFYLFFNVADIFFFFSRNFYKRLMIWSFKHSRFKKNIMSHQLRDWKISLLQMKWYK